MRDRLRTPSLLPSALEHVRPVLDWVPINGVPQSRIHHEVVYLVNQESTSDKEKPRPQNVIEHISGTFYPRLGRFLGDQGEPQT